MRYEGRAQGRGTRDCSREGHKEGDTREGRREGHKNGGTMEGTR